MRQVGSTDEAAKASRFADYLLTQGVETKVMPSKGGWDVWVVEEDQVPKARKLWAGFNSDPMNPIYSQASSEARKLRLQEERDEKAYEIRQASFDRKVSSGGAVRAPVTVFLVVASVGVYLLGMTGDKGNVRNTLWFAAPPTELTMGLAKPELGEPAGSLIRGPLASVAKGEVWRLISPIFIHMDGIHLLFNMLMLTSIGTAVEKVMGTWRIALMVLVLAVFSNCAEAFFGPSLKFGGMSGVLYGLAGFTWMLSARAPQMGLTMPSSTAMLLGGWLLLGVLMASSQDSALRMANWAHGGGLLAGIIMGWVVAMNQKD